MDKKCVKYILDDFIKEFNLTVPYPNIILYVDEENESKIRAFLIKQKRQFVRVLYQVLKGQYNVDHYGKENYDTTAMKFKGGENPRIYCREFRPPSYKYIVMIRLWESKKVQKNDRRIDDVLLSISKYNYNF